MRVIMFEVLLCLILLGFILLIVALIKYLVEQLRIIPKFTIRVQVDQELFLVVLYPNLTVSWLEDHVAERYFIETGVIVTVKIKDGSGAKMFSEDILWNMVNNGDQLGTDVTVESTENSESKVKQ